MKRILLIEDEELIRSFLARAFDREGYYIGQACSYSEAMKKIGEGGWDLAVVDLNLYDGMRGIEIIREFHRSSPTTKIVVITALDTEDIREMVMKEGVEVVFDKPFEIANVRKAIKGILRSGEAKAVSVV